MSTNASRPADLDKPGATINGFRLLKVEPVKEADSTARLFEHVRTGARLLYLSNKDDNKVFSIAFRTIPQDSTGIAHILEHSVLCGSRKFPSKEPFTELAKGSVNTFLNAMTYPDKTVYPIASRNSKDFKNLMDVYLDAVFFPRLMKAPEILKQEGWHYEVDPKTGELSYNGVVYNEMKGVYSSPDDLMTNEVLRSLFPKGTYGQDSGGDPRDIPNLTQKQFLEFHRKYYHPSNSYIYLYGDGDVAEQLKFIDHEYLSKFDREDIDSAVVKQKAFASPITHQAEYPIGENDSEKDKTFFSLSYAVGNSTMSDIYLGFDILEYILLESSASPLKRALLNAGIGKEVRGEWENGIVQPIFSVQLRNTNLEAKEKFMEVVDSTLRKLVKEGIPPKIVQAAINRKEFQLREFEVRSYPKGLAYNFKILDSWLYDSDPLRNVRFEPTLAKIKKAAGNRYFEKLIEKYLLGAKHRALVILKPKKGLERRHAEETQAKLKRLKNKMPAEELARITEDAAQLKKIQQTPDAPEVVAKIPVLDLKDLDPKAEVLPLAQHEEQGVKLLHHPVFTNGIDYVGLHFDTTSVPQDLIPYVSLLSDLLGKVSTKQYGYEDLANEINLNTGGISFGLRAYPEKASNKEFYPRFIVRSKAIADKLPKLAELVSEIALHSKFDDGKRLRELIQEMRSRMEASVASAGMSYAMIRASSYFSPVGKYNELTGGLSYYRFIVDLEKNLDKKQAEIAAKLQQVASLVFRRPQLLFSYTSDEARLAAARPELRSFIEKFPPEAAPKHQYTFSFSKDNEGFMIPSKVQFVTRAADFRKLGFEYKGSMMVLSNVLRTDYLWNRVRVQGGAYGAMMDMYRNGLLSLASYRDPNLVETFETYGKIAEYLKNFSVNEREMTKFVIGTVSRLDHPLTPSQKGEQATANFISHLTQDDIQKSRDEVLKTRIDDIRSYASLFEKAMAEDYLCVVGSESKLQSHKSLFGKLVPVFGE